MSYFYCFVVLSVFLCHFVIVVVVIIVVLLSCSAVSQCGFLPGGITAIWGGGGVKSRH